MDSLLQSIDVHELLLYRANGKGQNTQAPDLSKPVFVEDGEPSMAEVSLGFGSRCGEVKKQSKKDAAPWALESGHNGSDWGKESKHNGSWGSSDANGGSDCGKENEQSGTWGSSDATGGSDWGKENKQSGTWGSSDANGSSRGNGDSTHVGDDHWGSSAGGTGGSSSQGGWCAELSQENNSGSNITAQSDGMNVRRSGTFGPSGTNTMPLGKRPVSRKAGDRPPSDPSNEGVMKRPKGFAANQWDNEATETGDGIGTPEKIEGFWVSESLQGDACEGNVSEAGWSTGKENDNAAGNGNDSEAGWRSSTWIETAGGSDKNNENAEAGSGKDKNSVDGWIKNTGNDSVGPSLKISSKPTREAGWGSKSEPQNTPCWTLNKRNTNTGGGGQKTGPRIPNKRQQIRALLATPEYAEVNELVKKCSRILHCSGYQNGDQLKPEDEKFILEKVLSQHPSKDAKLGCGVENVVIDNHSEHEVSCFHILRKDGTKVDFSYWKCVESMIGVKSGNMDGVQKENKDGEKKEENSGW